ncbi:hypothetical protein Clacol_001905 [Clathrus columnatus]|uniref:Uncharacterized protein n=1 Tax=Clathrus columnatus TaxID=1419009 RepID=A0AAV5A3W6_9AGAM|nr:hypothetical protein Clacol_001905 [Clathrus columnatus]
MTIRNVDAQNDPNWTCSIDSFPLDTGGNNGIADTNRYILCSNDSLPLGQHTVSIDVRSLGTPFWFDYIRYQPGPTVSNDSKIIIYDSLNDNIQYDGTWLNSPNSGAHMTQTDGGTLSVPFNGTSISWVGFALTSLPEGAANAKYSLDLGPDVEFPIPTITPSENTNEFQETYFITPPVENGHHTLVVTYEGNGQTTPLMLDYFLVSTGPKIPDGSLGTSNTTLLIPDGDQSGTSSSPASSPSTVSGGNTSNIGSSKANMTDVGAIVGGVIGGLALVFIIALTIFLIRRMRRRERRSSIEASYHTVPHIRSVPSLIVSTNNPTSTVIDPWVPPQRETFSSPPASTSTTSGVPQNYQHTRSQSSNTAYISAVGSTVTFSKSHEVGPPGYSP